MAEERVNETKMDDTLKEKDDLETNKKEKSPTYYEDAVVKEILQ